MIYGHAVTGALTGVGAILNPPLKERRIKAQGQTVRSALLRWIT